MIEPILSLAFSIHSNKGVYALLLGSGVSRSAGIPTGWEVVLDLIQKLSRLKGEDCGADPEAWYRTVFGEEPNYSRLLEQIAQTPTERSQLLRNYFEPTEEDREQGLKVPTAAHRAIAQLVASGYVRVLVTTNFDRLLETALEAVGVIPTVISTSDAVKGALPLAHVQCLLVKVHGDYLDTRIRNSPAELDRYDDAINQLLDRIFDEFGLVVCGWSAEWDTALRAALERCQSRRFTTYWAARGDLSGAAKCLVQLRSASVVPIRDADSFLTELAEKVSALEDLARPHPLSVKTAVAILKRYLVDDGQRIRVHDLVTQETERLYAKISAEHFPVNRARPAPEEFQNLVRRYEAVSAILLAIMITGCYWGDERHENLWVRTIERLANLPEERSGNRTLVNLRWYPALLMLYGGGIASIIAGNYKTLATLFLRAKEFHGPRSYPLAYCLYAPAVMDELDGHMLRGLQDSAIPMSDHLFAVLREPFRALLPRDDQYEECFDRLEYLLALIHADLRREEARSIWFPVGRFARRSSLEGERSVLRVIELEATSAGEKWPPLQAGLFGGSLERFQMIKRRCDDQVRKLPMAF